MYFVYCGYCGNVREKIFLRHEYFKQYEDKKLDKIYKNYLIERKQADTLIAIATK